jgi:hypothetical protein
MSRANAVSLLGAWQLLSWRIYSVEHLPASEPFGPQPVGLLQYTADGWMSAAIGSRQRPLHPAGVSPRRLSPETLADSYRNYFHYAGTWRLEGDSVVHSVKLSLNPNMCGSEQVRHVSLMEPNLTLTGIEPLGQQQRRHVLLWQRAANPGITTE